VTQSQQRGNNNLKEKVVSRFLLSYLMTRLNRLAGEEE
jgi:hypothetical protein